jgi:CRP-like cAMP-binding protein
MASKQLDLPRGEVLFREGEPGDTMYVIGGGRIQVTKAVEDGEMVVAELGPGDFLGEMAILMNSPRSATALAVEDTSLMIYDSETFGKLIRSNPSIATRIIQLLTKRLKETTSRLAALQGSLAETKG